MMGEQLRNLCYDDRYRWIREQQDAEDVFNPRGFNLLVINEWGQETGIFIPFLEAEGNIESCGVPNIELMMQLIHSRKLWRLTLLLTCRNYRNSNHWKGFTIKGLTFSAR
jgi:hypothetical protein